MDWTVQIGPDVSGKCDGLFHSPTVTFLLTLITGDPNQTYAWFSATEDRLWTPIPNNEEFPISVPGIGWLAWKYDAPPGVSFKLFMHRP